jgi:hypothetical protein
MARDTHPTTDISSFDGLDNVNTGQEVGWQRLKEALNIDLTRSDKPRRRSGQTLITASNYVSVWSQGDDCLALDASGTVHQLDDAFASIATYTQLVNYGPHFKLRAYRILDDIIFSNGTAVGLLNAATQEEKAFDTSDYGDRTFDYSTPVAFNDIELFAGRCYYGIRNYLYYSVVFGYFKLRLGKDYFRFPDTITMVAQVENGLFVGTLEKTYFLSNRDPKQASLIQVDNTGVIEGTKTYVAGSLVGEGESTELLPVWSTTTGFCVGLPNGQVNRVTQKYVTLPQGGLGSAMFRNENGQNHIVSVIQT